MNKYFKLILATVLSLICIFILIFICDIEHINKINFCDNLTKTNYLIDKNINSGYIEINNVKYYININEMETLLNKSLSLSEGESIVSNCIKEKDKTYNKYDIYNDQGKKIIIFYKFKNEYDNSYDTPIFELEQFRNLFIKLKK